MPPRIQEVLAKTLVHRSRIPGVDFVINPYGGCAFGCRYCYADFTRRFHHGPERWGEYVDVRTNARHLLYRELSRVPQGSLLLLSSVTDPYQPVERKYQLTRQLLEILLQRRDLRVSLLTRSPLVTRDLDLFQRFGTRLEVGLSIPTDREDVRRVLEPRAPAIHQRWQALRTLAQAGVRTYAFLGPLLPCNPQNLARHVAPYVEEALVDRLNYAWKIRPLLRRHRWEFVEDPQWFQRCVQEIRSVLGHRLRVVARW